MLCFIFLHRFWTGLNFFIYPILKLILFNEHPLREALLAYYYNHETLCIYLIRDDTLVSRSPSSGLFSCVEVVRSDVSEASHLRKSTRESVFKSPDLSVSSSHPDSPADQWTHLEKNKTNKQTTLQYTDLYSMHKMHWSWVYQLVCLKNKDGFYDAQVRKRRRRSSWNNIFAMWKRKKKKFFKAADTNIDRKTENSQRLKKGREDSTRCHSRVSRKKGPSRSQGQPDLHSDPVWLSALCLTHVSHHSCSVPLTTSY